MCVCGTLQGTLNCARRERNKWLCTATCTREGRERSRGRKRGRIEPCGREERTERGGADQSLVPRDRRMHNGYMHVLPNPFFHMCVRVPVCVCACPVGVCTGFATIRLVRCGSQQANKQIDWQRGRMPDPTPQHSSDPGQARASSPAAWRGRVQLVSSFLLHSTAGRGMPSPRAWGRGRGSGAQSSCKQRATKSKSLKQFRRKSSKIVLHELRRQPETATEAVTEAETEIEQQKQQTEKKQ